MADAVGMQSAENIPRWTDNTGKTFSQERSARKLRP